MDIKHICFIVEGYPTNDEPKFTFVRQLICTIADNGIKCSVIVPQSVSHSYFRKTNKRLFHWVDTTKNNSKIDIYQPKYISFSNIKMGKVNLTYFFWEHTVINTFKKIMINPDILYAHFWHTGMVAAVIGKKYKLPVFVASGESKISLRELCNNNKIESHLDTINGVICVSQKNMEESLKLKLASKDKMIIIPNGIDSEVFYIENKKEIRKKLGYDDNDFIVAFTGSFDNRKGVLRLSEAINKIGGIKSIYIGYGEQTPIGEGILFCGKLPHNEIVHYLNAADVFVLPTLAEGCCNAIIEGMACGLPIISSNLSFNDDILNENNSIRVDSNNIDEISKAIQFLKDNPIERENMAKSSIVRAKQLDIEKRAQKIINFIEKRNGES